MQALTKEDLAKAESLGVPILLAVFGSFAAAALPLARILPCADFEAVPQPSSG